MSISEILDTLSGEQQRAVTTTEGNVRLVAGAGSGKTNTLTKRVAYLCLKNGIAPNRMLSLTFTNKAAEEMRQRVAKYMEVPEADLEMMTFHRLALNICKRDLGRLGFPVIKDENGEEVADVLIGSTPIAFLAKTFFEQHWDKLQGLSDEDRQFFTSSVIKYTNSIVKRHRYVDILLDENNVLAAPEDVIAYEKAKVDLGKQKKKVKDSISDLRKAIKNNFSRNAECYATMNNIRELQKQEKNMKLSIQTDGESPTLSWARALLQMKASTKTLDFDDIIMFSEYLLENYEEVRTYWQSRYDYIQVDEFQDTDYTQLNILKILAEKSHGLFVVGDPDQSIYMFRGVMPEVFNSLDEHLEGLQTIYMEDNYRSSNAVIESANAIIALNKNRLPKSLKPKSAIKDMEAPLACAGTEAYSAAQLEFHQIQKMLQNGVDPNSICVLYRDKNCKVTEELVSMLKKTDIPLDCQFKSSSFAGSFEDIVLNILKYRYSGGVNFLGNFIDGLYGEGYDNIFDSTIVDQVDTTDPAAVYGLLEDLYPKRFTKVGNPTGKYKKFCDNFVSIHQVVVDTVQSWNNMSEQEKQDACSEDSILYNEQAEVNGLHIMTIHKSKGLEFDYVFVNSMDQGMCPKFNNFTDIDSLEEDVRLAYVAITRAKKQVYLGFEKVGTMSAFIAQSCMAIEPIHASKLILPGTDSLADKVEEFNSSLDCYYFLKREGLYELKCKGATVGYRYAIMHNGSRIYFQASWEDIVNADAIPGSDNVLGTAEVTIVDGKIVAYEEVNKTVPVINVTDDSVLTDLFVNLNPLQALQTVTDNMKAA